MVSFRDYEIFPLFLLLVKFYVSGKCVKCLILSFNIVNADPLFLNVTFVEMISELWGGFQQFLYLDMMLGFQSRHKWSLNNYDAIESRAKDFMLKCNNLPYVQNISKLKLRGALFSWLVCIVFLAIRKLRLCQVDFHYKHDGYTSPPEELPCVHKLSSLPSIIHYWEELLPIFPLVQIMTSARITSASQVECDFSSRQQSSKDTT